MGRPRKVEEGKDVIETPVSSDAFAIPIDENKPEDRVAELEAKVMLQSKQMQELITIMKSRELAPEPKKDYKHTGKMMFVNENPVVVVGQVKDQGGDMTIKLTTMDKDGNLEHHSFGYLDAMNHVPRHMCEILKIEKHEIATHQGPIPSKVLTRPADEVAKRTATGAPFTPKEIVLQHTMVTADARVRFLEGPWAGREIEVSVDALNK